MKRILITGGAGFIGSHVIRTFINRHADYEIYNLDKLTYAGNLENLRDIENNPNYFFIKGDIADDKFINQLFADYKFDGVVHLAAETHVDRSILSPMDFVKTNLLGTFVLINAFKNCWKDNFDGKLFYHVSTDEVYGSLSMHDKKFVETTAYDPRSPYSAAKAGSDHLVRSYFYTFKVPVIVSNCSNNYGPNQFPEKLIPLIINNIRNNKSLPIYGKGENVRDWLYVGDHADAIETIFHNGTAGQTYNIGGDNEMRNIDIVTLICDLVDQKLNREIGTARKLITYVKDRPGHDLRYAIDFSKLKNALGWTPKTNFKDGISQTIDWYLNNEVWMNNVISGDYQKYYELQYSNKNY
jgi:dTDP-glucose 4,6-dehydratase